jgi:hypothetical protein
MSLVKANVLITDVESRDLSDSDKIQLALVHVMADVFKELHNVTERLASVVEKIEDLDKGIDESTAGLLQALTRLES